MRAFTLEPQRDGATLLVLQRFSPGGAAPGSNTTLRFCDDRGPESAREIRISASGRVRSLTAEETPSRPC